MINELPDAALILHFPDSDRAKATNQKYNNQDKLER